jgi:hypothetical protein
VNKPDQSASAMFRPTPSTTAQSFLPVSVYLGRSHSSFSLLFFFFFCFVLFYFLFPFLFPSFSRRLPVHKSRQKEKSPEYQPMAQMAAKFKESKLGPQPLRKFPGNYDGKYASSSVGRQLSKYTYQ